MAARKRNNTQPAKSDTIKVRMALTFEVSPDRWTLDETPDLDLAKLAEALIAQGVPADEAGKLAGLVQSKATRTGASEVREDLKAYVLGEVQKLEKIEKAEVKVVLNTHGAA